MTMGRKRSRAESIRASFNGIFPMRSMTKSRYRIAFFAERPINSSIPSIPKISSSPLIYALILFKRPRFMTFILKKNL